MFLPLPFAFTFAFAFRRYKQSPAYVKQYSIGVKILISSVKYLTFVLMLPRTFPCILPRERNVLNALPRKVWKECVTCDKITHQTLKINSYPMNWQFKQSSWYTARAPNPVRSSNIRVQMHKNLYISSVEERCRRF